MKTKVEIRSMLERNKEFLLERLGLTDFELEQIEDLSKHKYNALKLLSLKNGIGLGNLLNTNIFLLEKIINNPVYEHFSIAKKKGGFRDIYAPKKELKYLQKSLNYYLQAYYLIIKPKEVFGFVINPHYQGEYCNIAENAKVHVNKKFLLNIDLKDFFPSIKAADVYKVLLGDNFKFTPNIATAIALLCTYNGKLPTGAPTSPVLSNFICLGLDKDIKEYCETFSISYSRYADDLSFSSDTEITSEIIVQIRKIIESRGFTINNKKLHLQNSGCRQVVTGLTVNDKVNVNRTLLKMIRAMLFDLRKNGRSIATQNHFNLKLIPSQSTQIKFINKLEGYINFIGQVRGKSDNLYLKMKREFREVAKPWGIDDDKKGWGQQDFIIKLCEF